MNCERCKWWQDWGDRVFARVSRARGDIDRDLIELRSCKFIPAPAIRNVSPVYTDKNFCCGSFEEVK